MCLAGLVAFVGTVSVRVGMLGMGIKITSGIIFIFQIRLAEPTASLA